MLPLPAAIEARPMLVLVRAGFFLNLSKTGAKSLDLSRCRDTLSMYKRPTYSVKEWPPPRKSPFLHMDLGISAF